LGMEEFEAVYKERQVELAMRQIPALIKEIRHTAIGSIFADDLKVLDAEARATLDKVLEYMERKYISLPMKMAKEVLLNKAGRN
jgi:glutamyl-tRNA reductase